MDRIAAEKASVKKIFTWFFLFNCVCCVCTWVLFFYMFLAVGEDKDIATFDPFQVIDRRCLPASCLLLLAHPPISLARRSSAWNPPPKCARSSGRTAR